MTPDAAPPRTQTIADLYAELYDERLCVKVAPERAVELRAEIGRLTAEAWRQRREGGTECQQ